MSNREGTYVKHHDHYLVRWVGDDGLDTHIVVIEDNKLGEALCGLVPPGGWSKRGGVIKIHETKCEKCNSIAKELGIL